MQGRRTTAGLSPLGTWDHDDEIMLWGVNHDVYGMELQYSIYEWDEMQS